MRKAAVYVHDQLAGYLEELTRDSHYRFTYLENYEGPPISLSLPVSEKTHDFSTFPSFFDGLLPEGIQLEGLLKLAKLDREDYYGQLIAVGADTVGAVTVKEVE